jgi:4-amino-4-deoxy-L-arabinose transferase-like glycosyltransferase
VVDRDEAHFAQASRQMLQTGNYFQIRFQDRTRFQKPPGINWLQAASVKIFSKADASTIWPYRVPSLLSALLAVLLTYFFSRRLVGQKVAVLGSALLASTLLLVVETHMAVIDAALLTSVIIMEGALWQIYQAGLDNKQVHWGWALCFWLAMAYGLVLKGVTPLVGILSIATLCLIERQIGWLRGLRPFKGFTLFLLLSLAWVLMVNQAEHSNYLMQMIHKDLLPKLKGGHESHGKPPLFHLAILPLTFWPASLFLWQAAVYAFRNCHHKTVKFLLAWLLPTWFFFELMPTKLPQYVLPTFPAIALLCALAIRESGQTIKPGKWLRLLQILWGVLSVGLALFLASLPYIFLHQGTLVSIILVVEMTLITIAAVYFARQGLFQRAAFAVLLMALLSYPLVFSKLLPQLKPLWLTANLAELIDQNKISSDKPLLVVGFDEPSLVFYFNTQTLQFSDAKMARTSLQKDPSRLVIIEPAVFDDWIDGKMKLSILARTRGFNYSKGKWLELFIVSGASHRNW